MQVIKKWLNAQINKVRRIIVVPEYSLQIIDFQMKCLEITTYAKTTMM